MGDKIKLRRSVMLLLGCLYGHPRKSIGCVKLSHVRFGFVSLGSVLLCSVELDLVVSLAL